MKKFIKISVFLLFTSNMFAVPSIVNVINATTEHTLYYNVKLASKTNGYPIISASKVTGSYNYLTLGAGYSLSFSSFSELNTLYGSTGLNFIKQTSATSSTTSTNVGSLNMYCLASPYGSLNMEWAGFIYKVQNATSTEGSWMRFDDFASWFSGYNEYVSHTYTEAYTTYTIGGERYFVVSDL
ncbi:hypothetical protein G6N05_05790 [Flavobacterium sp. F372]|jgi:hypothetical protein|uniref:Uncharacterized protein n=1 Tax=Flavobacterium bernardetii TaxID=2813823 RepID=A0ABR7IZR8_9FLAO|nr:hypothetical protein [Flavobacterium bernardetii]MBC5835276.1 hypothetical protein [Flavobacterium bernardetii]NHF69621.1 hypothetical protein [Flavobacterium bernardetii]